MLTPVLELTMDGLTLAGEGSKLGWADVAVIACYFVCVLAVGLYVSITVCVCVCVKAGCVKWLVCVVWEGGGVTTHCLHVQVPFPFSSS